MDRLKLYKYTRRIISLLYPNRCPFCGKVINADKYMCESCPKFLPYVTKPLLPPENVSRLYACCYYAYRARTAVLSMKYKGLIYPVDAFALMMYKMISKEHAHALVPVPSGFMSVQKRGFSTADKIAERISWFSGVPVLKALKARDDKQEQKMLNMKMRIENARQSFCINDKADIRGKKLILIDDVCTTGSTLSVCAELLTNAGAAEVTAAVFAKTVDLSRNKRENKKFSKKRTVDLK